MWRWCASVAGARAVRCGVLLWVEALRERDSPRFAFSQCVLLYRTLPPRNVGDVRRSTASARVVRIAALPARFGTLVRRLARWQCHARRCLPPTHGRVRGGSRSRHRQRRASLGPAAMDQEQRGGGGGGWRQGRLRASASPIAPSLARHRRRRSTSCRLVLPHPRATPRGPFFFEAHQPSRPPGLRYVLTFDAHWRRWRRRPSGSTAAASSVCTQRP